MVALVIKMITCDVLVFWDPSFPSTKIFSTRRDNHEKRGRSINFLIYVAELLILPASLTAHSTRALHYQFDRLTVYESCMCF